MICFCFCLHISIHIHVKKSHVNKTGYNFAEQFIANMQAKIRVTTFAFTHDHECAHELLCNECDYVAHFHIRSFVSLKQTFVCKYHHTISLKLIRNMAATIPPYSLWAPFVSVFLVWKHDGDVSIETIAHELLLRHTCC